MVSAPLIAVILTAMVALLTLGNWRYGLLCIIVIGVMQDVLRKLTPEAPPFYIVWSMLAFGFVAAVALGRNALGSLRELWMGDDTLKVAFYLYFLVVIVQCLHSLLRWESPLVPLFGLIFYLGPVVALLVVIGFAKQEIWLNRFIGTYLLIMVPVCLTVYLSLLFKDSVPVLRDVGSFLGNQLVIYDVGTVLYSYPGLLRVGEIAAFHAAVCCAFLSMLMLGKTGWLRGRLWYALLIIALVGAIALTGRRKMLMALCIFWVLQFYFLTALRGGASRQAVVILVLGLVFSVAIGLAGESETSLYLQRGSTVFSGMDERVSTAINLFLSAIDRSSGVGLGAGIAAQGARFAGIDNSLFVGGSSESGIGLLVVELGIPGFIIIVWLLFNLARVVVAKLKAVARIDDHLLLYAVSFAALLLANMATFSVATQLYGDYFVLITLGVVAGMLYSTINRGIRKRALYIAILAQVSARRTSD
ncbi:MAG: hypothetical protein H6985_05995 [Pseudomonadales bacterium]|nr:hypothetical protein [Halioglobus sp.]MCP5129119.1 hypothetical protein [Pseudomonadales bacterium]